MEEGTPIKVEFLNYEEDSLAEEFATSSQSEEEEESVQIKVEPATANKHQDNQMLQIPSEKRHSPALNVVKPLGRRPI